MSLAQTTVAGRFLLKEKIGAGSFGEVYAGFEVDSHQAVAVKVEPAATSQPQLLAEAKTLRELSSGIGIPKVHWYGTEQECNLMVLQLLGASLEQLHLDLGPFSLKTTLQLGLQMLERVQFLHEHDVIHRDIKPENFLMGVGSKAKILYIVDFGLAKKYRDPKMRMHIRYREGKSLTGTARYASISTHAGIEQSRRDDIEAVGYSLVYLARGFLPWQNLGAHSKQEKYHHILELKRNLPLEQLCEGLPAEFIALLAYSRALQFECSPDYLFLKGLLNGAAVSCAIAVDGAFEWTRTKQKKPASKGTPMRPKHRKKRSQKLRAKEELRHQSQECLETLVNNEFPVFADRKAVNKLLNNNKELNGAQRICALF